MKIIDSIINRRENNIKKWLNNLTSSFSDKSIDSLKEFDSLKEKWKLCNENCSSCFYRCTKILGHLKEHNCGLDHICHEKCEICNEVKCKEFDICNHFCFNQRSGHLERHKCKHFHQCQNECSNKNLRGCKLQCCLEYNHEGFCNCKASHLCDEYCIFYKCSKNCKGKCNLEINHQGEHKCGIEAHKCIRDCRYKDKSIGCINEGKCDFNLPHDEENCNCRGEHKCIQICSLYGLSKGCNKICFLPYDHNGEHLCSEFHKCIKPCELNGKKSKCEEECSLAYGHKGLHRCNKQIHYCLKDCFYKEKSRNCIDNQKCILPYEHEGKCNCGTKEHLCKGNCSIKSCQNICNLPFEHKENHDCKKDHKCNKRCSLEKDSKKNTCDGICNLDLGHEGECFCTKLKENHYCNGVCSSINCKNECGLVAGHKKNKEKELCICGNCSCGEVCKFINCSRNCKKKCKENYGHNGDHICEEKNHLCNEKCCFKDDTREGCKELCSLSAGHLEEKHFCENSKEKHLCKGECSYLKNCNPNTCDNFCNRPIGHNPPCICKYLPEEHICNEDCYLKSSNYRGCKSKCSLPFNHKGEHICSAGIKGHLCKKKCSYLENTRIGCKIDCILPFDHVKELKCICSTSLKKHICKEECILKSKSREGCNSECIFNLSQTHTCLCNNPKDKHICNKPCSLKDKSIENSCNNICNKSVNHEGECICSSKIHECKEFCKYKDFCRCGCLEICSKEAGHDGEHICKNKPEKHKCKENCSLNKDSSRGCNVYCNKEPFHEGIHLCSSEQKNHKCNKQCNLFNKCSKGCKIYCQKFTGGHGEVHNCCSGKHICNNKCELLSKSRGCQSNCTLLYGHSGKCICSKRKEEHFCAKKCQLCNDYCNYRYNHENENNNQIYHLCNKEHYCNKECNQKGYCEINTGRNINIRKSQITINLKSNENILYIEETEQNKKRKKCILKIPIGHISHGNEHKCQNDKHKCGEICKQCNRLCELEEGHKNSHYCIHGQIINSSIKTEESIKMLYNNKFICLSDEDPASMYTCYQACKEFGRGHIHMIYKDKIKGKDINNRKIKKYNNDLYECKCEFFWKIYLNFEYETEFEQNLKNEFNKCPAKCSSCLDYNNKTTYCCLDLWHKPENNSNNNDDNYWISIDGHKFTCKHYTPYHTIFLIDCSSSMNYGDLKPKLEEIKNNPSFNNRLGVFINVVENYSKNRNNINKEDVFSLISFNENSKIIFKNLNLNKDNKNLIDECMNNMQINNGTNFLSAFKKANEILSKINKKKYKPIIILLTDGDDNNKDETINYIENVSILFIII